MVRRPSTFGSRTEPVPGPNGTRPARFCGQVLPPAEAGGPGRAPTGRKQARHTSPAFIAVLALAAVARADPPTTGPSVPPSPPPSLLEQLSDQTHRAYARARLGMVRVRLPTPPWLARENRLRELMARLGTQLDPDVRRRVVGELAQAADPSWPRASTVPLPVPMTAPTRPEAGAAPTDRVLVATGVLLDTAGHVVLPLYLDRADLGEWPTLAAVTGDGRPTTAAFVGSDRATNLTVVKLADPGPRPAPLAAAADAGRPADGAIALVVTPEGLAHLTVWTAASTDVGLVLRVDGAFAGFGFADDFLPMSTARPITDQLIASGTVRRPALGVVGVGMRRSYLFDPAADSAAVAAGGSPDGGTPDAVADGPSAVFVRVVDPDGPAARGGVRPGDVILAVDGRPVGPRTFAAAITVARGPTPLRVRRGSQTQTLSVDLRLDGQ